MKHYYYPKTHDMICKAVIDMFNDMTIYRYHPDTGDIINTINVPVTFSPVEKIYQFRKEQESGKQYYLTLPRIAIVYNGTAQAVSRATSINTERFFLEGKEVPDVGVFSDYQPVPTDYIFTVKIKTEMMADYAQIIENIIPYFAPDATSLRVREFSFLNLERNLKTTMTSIAANINTNLDDQTMRELEGEFTLTVEGYCYRPIDATGGLIEEIDVKYFMGNAKNWFSESNIIGYQTSATMPPADTVAESGINSNSDYYTIKHIEGI